MARSPFGSDHIRAMLSAAPEPPRGGTPGAAPEPAQRRMLAIPGDALSAESEKFLAAWRSWRGSDLLPRRRQVQLTGIARLMPQILVLEVHGPERAVFRLVGSDVEDLFGARLTGRSFIKLADDAEQPRRAARIWAQATQPAASVGYQTLQFRSGRRETIEIASAPVLPDSDGEPVQLFAVASRMPRPAPQHAMGARDIVVRNFGHNLRFVDIGAGLPVIV